MGAGIKERDWKLLRTKLPKWQEAYIGKLLDGYADLLGTDAGAADRFWELDERIKRDRSSSGVAIYGLSRSNAMTNILNLLADGVIGLEDLEGFSDEVLDAARFATRFEG